MRMERVSTSSHHFPDIRSWRRGMAPLAALLLMACSGSPQERGRTDAGTATRDAQAGATASAPGSPSSAPASTPAAVPASTPGPNLTYGVVDTSLNDEVPIRWTPVFPGAPRTRLEGDALWAPAAEVVRVLSPGARVTFEEGQLKVDGKTVAARARVENGEAWAEVVPLARHLGALGRVLPEDRSVVLFPRATLLWLRDHGDPNAPAVREARAAGLLEG